MKRGLLAAGVGILLPAAFLALDAAAAQLSSSNPTGGATLGTRTSAALTILENETVLQSPP